MTDNEKLARWQGWKEYNGTWSAPETLLPRPVPNYLNDDAAAMSLLDTLVEKGYEYDLCGDARKVDVRVFKGDSRICISIKPTRRGAVVAAVLELIEKEVNK